MDGWAGVTERDSLSLSVCQVVLETPDWTGPDIDHAKKHDGAPVGLMVMEAWQGTMKCKCNPMHANALKAIEATKLA